MGYGDQRRPGEDSGAPQGDPSAGGQTTTAEKGERPPERHRSERERADGGDTVPGRAHARSSGSGIVTALLALLVGLALGVGGALLFDSDAGVGGDPFAGQIDSGSYQAVILANDRVYFGQIRSANDEFYRLENAFFLRESRTDAEAEPVRALLPVNREIHGPKNEMLIARSEVVLIEDLAEDSPILREIERQSESEGEESGDE